MTDNATLAFNLAGTATYAGAISGTGNLTQLGPGTLILPGTVTYSGATTVVAGTLLIGTGGSLGRRAPLFVSGVLDLGGGSQTAGAVTLSGGTIQNGTLTGTSYASVGGDRLCHPGRQRRLQPDQRHHHA